MLATNGAEQPTDKLWQSEYISLKTKLLEKEDPAVYDKLVKASSVI